MFQWLSLTHSIKFNLDNLPNNLLIWNKILTSILYQSKHVYNDMWLKINLYINVQTLLLTFNEPPHHMVLFFSFK
jgi:hypothetical protein